MRVIGGEFRSRVLKSMPGMDVRPTPDRLRETLFNILAPRIADAFFVDAYAGTGAVGIEALSRGARRVVFVERSRPAAMLIRENLRSLGAESRADVIQAKTTAALRRFVTADIVFLDPPYPLEREYAETLELLGEQPPSLVIVQHDKHFRLAERYGKLAQVRTVKQGENVLTFYEPEASGE